MKKLFDVVTVLCVIGFVIGCFLLQPYAKDKQDKNYLLNSGSSFGIAAIILILLNREIKE